MEDRKVKVNIFGNTYNIQGDASPEYINKLAKYVDFKMNEVAGSMHSGNMVHAAILAALNIADEYFQLKELDSNVDERIVNRTNALISMLEEGLIGDVFNIKNISETER